jgi:hypothetical protein
LLINGLSAFTAEIDNVSVKELQVLGDDLVTNGDFATDSDWIKGDGWSIAAGLASCDGSQAGVANFYQAGLVSVGEVHIVKFTLSNYSAGNLTVLIGGIATTANYSSNGTYTAIQVVQTGSNDRLYFRGDVDFIGDIDNVSLHQLTFGRQISDDSTNYAGFQFLLPIDKYDFCIPVDYVAESIVAQQFHDGVADGMDSFHASIKPNFSVSESGQKLIGRIDLSQYYYMALKVGSILTSGVSYRVTFRYRTNIDSGNGQVRLHAYDAKGNFALTSDGEWHEVDLNDPTYLAGGAHLYIVATSTLTEAQDPANYFEIDNLHARPIIDGEFYEPESLGGDPVIVQADYFYNNPYRYLTRYFNYQQWTDLMLLESGHSLTYADHLKILKFTKNT